MNTTKSASNIQLTDSVPVNVVVNTTNPVIVIGTNDTVDESHPDPLKVSFAISFDTIREVTPQENILHSKFKILENRVHL